MAIKTGTITVKPTMYGANRYGSSNKANKERLNSLINGEQVNSYGYLYTGGTSIQAFYYGFNFEELRNKQNVKITDIRATATYRDYNNSTGKTKFIIRMVTGFPTSGTTMSYTDLGDGEIYFVNSVDIPNSYTTVSKNSSDMPNALSWINSNITAFLNGFTSNSFGVHFFIASCDVSNFTLSVDYTYEEIEYVTVSTEVSPAGAGTVSPATQQVESGATATVTATPATGYKFSHWLINGAESGVNTPTLTGTITNNIVCTAVFILDKINKILCDISQPKKILIDKQEAKAVYIDTTKVY